MFILYTVAPILYRMASSAYYNLSLLSSDFYGLLFGLFLFVSSPSPHTLCHIISRADPCSAGQHYSVYWLYFPAFVVVILGLIIYFWHAKRTSFLRLLSSSRLVS